MKQSIKQREPQSEQKTVYQQITDQVIAQLEKGVILWKKPWAADEMPHNVSSRHYYKGWNAFYLNMICLLKEFEYPHFLTFKQAEAMDGNIRKGEHGFKVIYFEMKQQHDKATMVTDKKTGETKLHIPTIPILKQFTVFNIAQTEGIEFEKPESHVRTSVEKIETCEKIIAGMKNPPPIKYRGNQACYIPSLDVVHMPQQKKFYTDESYYSTLFHELVHSTGHASRLNREEVTNPNTFGSQPYSKEELVAELGNAYLSGVTGILPNTLENSAAYIEGWLNRLRHNDKFFLQACSQAQQAADYIIGETLEPLPVQTDIVAA
ncbi:ArdC family protein [Chitinophaga rhizophila]|uniref:SsDNA-binding domain-containing protein n=1 Tax=Chitinophaga rhizophila TaxID=2866212 RepID=A0ABS7G7S3_9BACT|nr:zincin-like metallopeptidase domain-containing protein [Chitinophaga rhizophila]MBW8683496.1 ssDNA-binding domain-containing protein [Chitinophaga rhizophila]